MQEAVDWRDEERDKGHIAEALTVAITATC